MGFRANIGQAGFAVLAALGSAVLLIGCNALFGIDDLAYDSGTGGVGGVGGVGGNGGSGTGGTAVGGAGGVGGDAGGTIVPPSCQGLPTNCGPNSNENCCANALVPGGTFPMGRSTVLREDAFL